jgi:hypothetical protein
MPIINPDTSESGNIPPNTYSGKIVQVDYQESKAGNPMIVVKFSLDVNGTPRTRQSYLVITGAGAYGFDQLLRACGFEDDADKIKEPGSKHPFDTDSLLGQELNIVVTEQLRDGQVRDNVSGYLKA